MTATLAAIAPERELQGLYERYKALALAAAASLILEENADDVTDEVMALLADARAALRRASRLEPQLAACVEAAARLRELLDPEASVAELEAARATHRWLRREIWTVLPCEYVPCCAGEHAHDER